MNPFGWSDEYLAKQIALIGWAVAYDVESLPNIFSLNVESIHVDDNYTFEISRRRNDTIALTMWIEQLRTNRVAMIGYNNIGYDYILLHWIIQNSATLAGLPGDQAALMIKEKSNQIINARGPAKFKLTVWPDQRYVEQLDLFLIHHFNNKAKIQSLKGLEFNMRSESVLDMPVPHDQNISDEDIDQYLIPYNIWDVRETKKFALISAETIAFRREMVSQIQGDVMNFNDTKIGKEMLIQRIGLDTCFTWSPKKSPRQTVRTRVDMNDVVFPYIKFEHPEFNRVLNWIKSQVLTSIDLDQMGGDTGTQNNPTAISTKGVFTDVHAVVNGFRFDFGTGGIHGSVERRRYQADDEWLLRDIDVASLYPSVAIVNQLFPEHLGHRFVEEYANLKRERFKYDKKTAQNAALKLALNGSYGDSGNEYSPLFDKQFLLKITINGQLMLCMLAEQLMKIPTVEPIQINTDGITYRIHKTMLPIAQRVEREWQEYTLLDLEDQAYSRMWIRDVNSYVAESPNGKLKLKGAYWYADGTGYDGGWTEAISKAGPSAWHKDLGGHVIQRAAVAAMVHGTPVDRFLREHRDPFDFMLRARAQGDAKLFIDSRQVQRTTRYYISQTGGNLHKIAEPKGPLGQYKPRQGLKVDSPEYVDWHNTWGNVHNPEIHTKNESKFEMVDTGIQTGYLVNECNLASDFSFDNLNYAWYEAEARKLIIGET